MNALVFQLPEAEKNGKNAFDHVHDIAYVHGIVKTAISVNIKELSGAALERALAQRLRELLASVGWLKGWEVASEPITPDQGFDFQAILTLPGGKAAELWVVCKANPRPHQIAYDRTQDLPSSQSKRQSRVWVLAAPFISPRMAQLCQE
ncbi:MAG: hypothetical protein ABSA69_05050, partial [Verrucomicrobiota bacterium]